MTRRSGRSSQPARSSTPTGGPKVLIAESAKMSMRQAKAILSALGYTPVEASADGNGLDSVDLILAGLPGGEELARAAVGRERRPALVLACSGTPQEGAAQAAALGADAYLLRPYKAEVVAPVLRAMESLLAERRRAAELEADLAAERARLRRFGTIDPETGFHPFESFQQLLVMELKRARRYGYSLAVCLVAVDLEGTPPPGVHAQVARALRSVIRDIDMPVDYADGRFLVFLPYTDLAGAERVGRRLEAAVRKGGWTDEDGARREGTVSVGIAALKPGQKVSFAKLVHDASSALRAAQLKGGGQVVVRQ